MGLSGDPRDTRLIDRIFLVLNCGFTLQSYLWLGAKYDCILQIDHTHTSLLSEEHNMLY